MAVLGGLEPRRAHHRRVWELLGVEEPASGWRGAVALPRRAAVPRRASRHGRLGRRSSATRRSEAEAALRGAGMSTSSASSARWGVEKPRAGFFERIVAEARLARAEIAYVGDRVDNDVEPALAAGMVAVHLRRGPWGFLHEPPRAAIRVALARRAAGGAGRCLSCGSASGSTRMRSRTACRWSSAASRSSIRAASRATPDGDVIAHALDGRRARRRGPRRHRLALSVRRRALAGARLARPAPRGLGRVPVVPASSSSTPTAS